MCGRFNVTRTPGLAALAGDAGHGAFRGAIALQYRPPPSRYCCFGDGEARQRALVADTLLGVRGRPALRHVQCALRDAGE